MFLNSHVSICSVCGAESRQSCPASGRGSDETDLEFRPIEKGKAEMTLWLQKCPECGYVSPAIEEKSTVAREWLESDRYRTCDGRKFQSDLAGKYYQFYLISLKEGDADNALQAALHASWSSDDAGDKENADFCRNLAMAPARWLIENYENSGEELERKKKTILIRADVLRRLGRFDQLLTEYKHVRFMEERDERLNQAIAFQLMKAQEHDDGYYSFADAKALDDVRAAKSLEEIRPMLFRIPPDFEALKNITIRPTEASVLAYEYVQACEEEKKDEKDESGSLHNGCPLWYWKDPGLIQGRHSTHLCEVIAFLLSCGLDPNDKKEGNQCLMVSVCRVVNGYAAADTLRLLLECGGDPNIAVENKTLFDTIHRDVVCGATGQYNRRTYDSLVHCWMVLTGYGGKTADEEGRQKLFKACSPLQGEEAFGEEKLKDHRNYVFGLTCEMNREKTPVIHIFDKRTFWEVARLFG